MLNPIITLWGMYNYNNDIFNKMTLPDNIDKSKLITYIFMYAGKNECRYSDANELQTLISVWVESRKYDWNRMMNAMTIDYSPIENYDRIEEQKHGRHLGSEREKERFATGQSNTNSISGSYGESREDIENTTSAFNSNTYQPKSRNESYANSSDNSTSNGHSEIENDEKEKETENSKEDMSINIRAHGNIGVTTNQQMINSELELRQKNVYKLIALEFEDEFTIPVYNSGL